MWAVKIVLIEVTNGMKTLLGTELEATHYILAKNLSKFCPCPEMTVCDAEFKCIELINLVEVISRQHSIWITAWVLLATFSQAYHENQSKMKILKSLQFDQKSTRKTGAKEAVVVEEINTTKKKPRTLYQSNRKESLRAFQQDHIHHRFKRVKM